MRLKLASLLTISTLVVTAVACTDNGSDEGSSAAGRTTDEVVNARLISALAPFDACGDLLDHVRTEAVAHPAALGYGGYGNDWRTRAEVVTDMPAATAGPPSALAEAGKAADESAGDAPGFSTTNIAEAGVDEPDIVKTNGRRIFTVAQGRLHAVAVARDGGEGRLAGTLDLSGGGGDQLLLAGDRLLVISSGYGYDQDARAGVAAEFAPVSVEGTQVRMVDVSDPAAMRITGTLDVTGRVIGARMVGDVARLVTAASPRPMPMTIPPGPGPEAKAADEANRRQVDNLTLTDWLPSFRLSTMRAEGEPPAVRSGQLVRCERVSHPVEFSGLGTISVLTFDLSEDLGDGDAISVMADGQTVYASTDAIYVATTRYADAVADPSMPVAGPSSSTEIHKFAIRGGDPAVHVASGSVRGHVLNQFSLSEYEGHLRVATTSEESGTGDSESFVTVLAERAGRLETTGMVSGLGRGERIYAVRFLGAVGYVVTFRQTDPLYTIDLSDPSRPLMVGELKIPGYSAYLHPLGDGLLLGVGQDATDQGRRLGAQMSLFDVSDPARPQRLDQAALGSGGSSAAVEFDHHAFLWWGPRNLAVVPVHSWDGVSFQGVVGFKVARGAGIDEIGRASHQPAAGKVRSESEPFAPPPIENFSPPIQRSLVIGERLYTLSDAGVLVSGLADLAPQGFTAFS